MNNDKRTTEATVELADNGYILRINNGSIVVVYASHDLPNELCAEILGDLELFVEQGDCDKFRVKVEVEPINDNDED